MFPGDDDDEDFFLGNDYEADAAERHPGGQQEPPGHEEHQETRRSSQRWQQSRPERASLGPQDMGPPSRRGNGPSPPERVHGLRRHHSCSSVNSSPPAPVESGTGGHGSNAFIGFQITRQRKSSSSSRSDTERTSTDDDRELALDVELPSPAASEGIESAYYSQPTSRSTSVSPLDLAERTQGSSGLPSTSTAASHHRDMKGDVERHVPRLVRSQSQPRQIQADLNSRGSYGSGGADAIMSPGFGLLSFSPDTCVDRNGTRIGRRPRAGLSPATSASPSNPFQSSRVQMPPRFSFSDRDLAGIEQAASSRRQYPHMQHQAPMSPPTPAGTARFSPTKRMHKYTRAPSLQELPRKANDAGFNARVHLNLDSPSKTGAMHPIGAKARRRRVQSSTEVSRFSQALPWQEDSPRARGDGVISASTQPRAPHRPISRAEPSPRTLARPAFKPKDIRVGSEIGRGSFGAVYRALDTKTGVQFAVKRLVGDGDESKKRTFLDEVRVMESLSHKNIVDYIGSIYGDSTHTLEIYLEYVPGGSLASLVKTYGALDDCLVRSFTAQMVSGVRYLHDSDVIHRDIKGGNVLVTIDGACKLADFGCSKLLLDMNETDREQTLQRIRGSVPWMAPEVVRETKYHFPADIWSLGATVLEMASGERPWPAAKEQIQAILKIGITTEGPPIPDHVSSAVYEFLQPLFAIDPSQRPLARELECQPFLSGGSGRALPAAEMPLSSR